VGSLPPFNDEGLYAKLVARGRQPKIFATNTSAEYWRGDASLIHTDDSGMKLQNEVVDIGEMRTVLSERTAANPAQVISKLRITSTSLSGSITYSGVVCPYVSTARPLIAAVTAAARPDAPVAVPAIATLPVAW